MPIVKLAKHAILIIVLATQNTLAIGAETTCGGISTTLYSSNDLTLSICHGPYTAINRSKLHQWQNCDDAMVLISDKKQRKTSIYADCGFASKKQFMLRNNAFMLRHFYSGYPNFEEKPLLIETLNLVANTKKYELLRTFPVCRKKDINNAIQQIDSTRAKPFDDKTFFTSIYGGFYKLRDCAATDSKLVYTSLRKYQENKVFDGEVAETLSMVISEVELIAKATNQPR
jgi:hypothetical protein